MADGGAMTDPRVEIVKTAASMAIARRLDLPARQHESLVADVVETALSALDKLRRIDAQGLAEDALRAACTHCNDSGMRHPHCFRCDDSTDDHICPDPVPCDHAEVRRVVERYLAASPASVAQERGGVSYGSIYDDERRKAGGPFTVEEVNHWEGVRCVEMPCCGFSFDASHTDDKSDPQTYTCPLCSTPAGSEEARASGENETLKAALKEMAAIVHELKGGWGWLPADHPAQSDPREREIKDAYDRAIVLAEALGDDDPGSPTEEEAIHAMRQVLAMDRGFAPWATEDDLLSALYSAATEKPEE